MSTDMDRFLQDYIAAWNSHDFDKLSPFFTDDCIDEDIGEVRVCHGKQEFKAYYEDMHVWSADFKFEMKSFFTAGNWFAGQWVMSGTHTGDRPGLKATGKEYSLPGASVGELREGKISRNTDYWNLAAFLQQVGLLPTPNWFGRLMMRLLTKR